MILGHLSVGYFRLGVFEPEVGVGLSLQALVDDTADGCHHREYSGLNLNGTCVGNGMSSDHRHI
jgi:hypothetical protein